MSCKNEIDPYIREEIESLFYNVMLPRWYYADRDEDRKERYVQQTWEMICAIKKDIEKTGRDNYLENRFFQFYNIISEDFTIETDPRKDWETFYLFGKEIKGLPKGGELSSEPEGQNGLFIKIGYVAEHINLLKKLSGLI